MKADEEHIRAPTFSLDYGRAQDVSLEYINVSRPAIISWWAGLDELTLSLEEWESWCTRRDKEETSGADLTFPIFLEL